MALIAAAQQPDLRVNTTEVPVPVSVTDQLNRPIHGLKKENFHVFDDGVEQTITSFANDDEEIALGLVQDSSESMTKTIGISGEWITQFFNQTANPQDEFSLVGFDSRARLLVPLTVAADVGDILTNLTWKRTTGLTPLLDAVELSLHELRKSKKRKKALLIVSDGGENNSRHTRAEVDRILREADVTIYCVGVYGGGQGLIEEIMGPMLLKHLAEETGGRVYPPQRDVYARISLDLRDRYVLGFSPTNNARDGRLHHIKVVVDPPQGLPKLKPHWRQGYYAPC